MTTIRQAAAPAMPRPAGLGAFAGMLPDPPKNGDKMNQEPIASSVRETLRVHFADSPGTLVGGEGYLRLNARESEGWVVPDCLVAFGVNPEAILARNGYVINEVGKPPDFALEIASESTGEADYTTKRDRYEELEVPEYWRFDATGGLYHDLPIAGDALVNGRYRPIEIVREPSGLLWGRSAVLGLDLCWDEGLLRLYDPVVGEFLRAHSEERAGRRAAEARWRDSESRRRDSEARWLESESRRLESEASRQAERERRLAAEAENRRLRERLLRGGR